jgi:hypothetical protein
MCEERTGAESAGLAYWGGAIFCDEHPAIASIAVIAHPSAANRTRATDQAMFLKVLPPTIGSTAFRHY